MTMFLSISFVLEIVNNQLENKDKTITKREIIKTWLAGHCSCTLVIPKDFAKQYGLDEPSHVVVEGTSEGILIRKLHI
jgi:hypothetical protein